LQLSQVEAADILLEHRTPRSGRRCRRAVCSEANENITTRKPPSSRLLPRFWTKGTDVARDWFGGAGHFALKIQMVV
jgi:hypothetical protein